MASDTESKHPKDQKYKFNKVGKNKHFASCRIHSLLSNYRAGEDSWEYLGQQGDQTSQSSRKSTLNIHWKDQFWSWSSNALATWCEELAHWKRLWCWERLRTGERDDRRWDGWKASLTQWTWVWADSREAWCAAVHGVTKSQTWLNTWTTTNNFSVFTSEPHLSKRSQSISVSNINEKCLLLKNNVSFIHQ